MKSYIFKFSKCLIIALSFSSCQKEIDIDLNSKWPQIVIEAEISDQPVSCQVKLTRTVNFNETNNFPTISGAVVRISDDIGNSEILIETSAGIYTSATLQGIPGRTYTLTITDNGKDYTAISKMPAPTDIDTLKVENSFFGNDRLVTVEFQDTAGIENQYRFIQMINGILQKSIFITNDYLQDGNNLSFPLFSRGEDSLVAGDSVTVLLQSIDKGVYEYFRTLSQLSGGGGQSTTPANPASNFTSGALGYFSAYAVRSKFIVIQ